MAVEMTLPDRGAYHRRLQMTPSPNATLTRTVFTHRQIAWDFFMLLARALMAGVLIGLACAAVVALLAATGA